MPFDRESAALSRALYEESPMPVRDIAALHGVSERSVYRYAARHGWRRRRTRLAIWQQSFRAQAESERATAQNEATAMQPIEPAAAVSDTRRALVARLWRAAEYQLAAIETRLAQANGDPVEMQACTQSHALLSRTVQQLALLDRALAPKAENDDFPQSDDELRRELQRKLDALVAREEN